ncbi:acid phosphatase 1-like [Trifolium pratense]|uniref:acid phosphatase 1-like n=1 Tax=Trifolium pratense TaxID=57577 RepID=UPI001E690E97|nr:acid phosphatase 1-like [Trifolium pratense]
MDSVARLTIILFFSWIGQISSESILKLPSEKEISGEYCDSWRLAVETNNVGSWNQIPANCVDSVAEYMIGERYKRDCDVVGKFSTEFAKRVAIGGDGRDAWVFDIDETLLSNVPYYQAVGFGSEIFNETSFNDWVNLADAPALPASLNLYRKLQDLGFTIFLLTGRSEHQRNATEANLLFAGYRNWERLILRGPSDQGKSATNFKSQKREELIIEGYRIHGSSGDQWSDLWGFAVASRSFKLPNPMYFIP